MVRVWVHTCGEDLRVRRRKEEIFEATPVSSGRGGRSRCLRVEEVVDVEEGVDVDVVVDVGDVVVLVP